MVKIWLGLMGGRLFLVRMAESMRGIWKQYSKASIHISSRLDEQNGKYGTAVNIKGQVNKSGERPESNTEMVIL